MQNTDGHLSTDRFEGMNLPQPVVQNGASALTARIFLAQGKILELAGSGAELEETFTEFCISLERLFPDSIACVTLIEPSSQALEVLAAPSLPDAFRQSITGLTIGLAPGTCCAAAHGNETIVSEDLQADGVWEGV